MTTIKSKPCKTCGSELHTAAFCRSKAAVNARMAKKAAKPVVKRKKKLTATQVLKKARDGQYITKADEKILFNYQKDKAWRAFSTYIRIRDCLATTGTTEYGVCITCSVRGDDEPKPYSMIQAGHAVGGRGNAVLFHEEIVNGQCSHCNRQGNGGLAGDYGNYMTFLVRKYGLEHADELQRLKNAYLKLTYQDLKDIEKKYLEKTERLLNNTDKRTKLL